MATPVRFSTIVAPVDFEEAPEDESGVQGLVVDAGQHRVVFSPATLRAVQVAASMAQAHGARLHLLHAVPPMTSSAMYHGPVSVPAQLIDEIHERAVKTSTQAMSALATQACPDLAVELSVTPGQALQFVLDTARKLPADLIVMAASGRSRVARFFVGSTADRVIRESACPVLVVPAEG